MPIITQPQSLPTIHRLQANGHTALSAADAQRHDLHELHIGLLNMMPDAALQVTEAQFIRLANSSNRPIALHVHPFTVPGLSRSPQTQAYIDKHYTTFQAIQQHGLDALIITGANVSNPHLQDEPFWDMLTQVMDWAHHNVTSVLCSCLATHALLQYRYQQTRTPQPQKVWGVFSHHVTDRTHPLLQGTNTRFDVPHSRWNAISRSQVDAAGLDVLVESDEAGVHMAASPDGISEVYFQGHPEYDTVSLLKEYKRDVLLYLDNDYAAIDTCPPFPAHYFSPEAATIANDFVVSAERAKATGRPLPDFPEAAIEPYLHNTWSDTARAVFSNWINLICDVNQQANQTLAARIS
jgi:homoserine O-succinyltransferase